MLVEVLGALGVEASVEHRATAESLDADLLLIAGGARSIEGLPHVLASRRPGGPTTVLWQLEPLPPVCLDAEGEAIGRRLLQWDYSRLSPTWKRLLKNVPLRGPVVRGIRHALSRPYARRVHRDANLRAWGTIDANRLMHVVGEYLFLSEAVQRGWIDHVFASTAQRVAFLASRGVDATFTPVGYHRRWGEDQHVERDIDVLLLGRVRRTRRRCWTEQIERELARHGRRLVVIERDCYGWERQAILSRTRIALNLLKFPWDFPAMRLLMSMGCGALVVSESCDITAPFVPGEHFVTCLPDDMGGVLLHYLEDEPARAAMASRGHAFVTNELTLERALSGMLSSVGLIEKSLHDQPAYSFLSPECRRVRA